MQTPVGTRDESRRRHSWWWYVAFALAIGVTILFSLRVVHRWRDRSLEEPIQEWMSIRHVARAYHVPPEALYAALDLPVVERDRRPIRALAREQNRSVDEVIKLLETAIAQARPPRPPPAPTPPPGDQP